MTTLRHPALFVVLMNLVLACTAYTKSGDVLVASDVGDLDPHRFVVDDGALAISRPGEVWTIEVDSSEPPVVARMTREGAAVVADVQVQQVPGVPLAVIKGAIEEALAAEAPDLNILSGRNVEVHGTAAYELTFTATREGTVQKTKMLVCKPGDTLYVVKCWAPADEWPRVERECDAALASFELLPEHGEFWGRRIEWEAEAGPEAREHASFILDPSRDRAVLTLGSGYQPYLDPLGDAWAYDLDTDRWSALELEGDAITPGGSRRAARVRDGAFLHGGYGKNLVPSRDLWALRFEDTRVKVTRVEQENPPEPRSLHAFATDARGERFVIFGGGSPTAVLGDTWIGTKSGNRVTWRRLDLAVNPGPRFGFAFAYDEKNGRLVLCGGQISSSDGSQVEEFALDSWALNFTAQEPEWRLLAEYDPHDFPGRRNPAFTFDQRSGDLLVWGGAGGEANLIPDLYIVQTRENGAPVRRVPQSRFIPTRASSFGVVDAKRSRALMGFGNTRFEQFLDLVEVNLRP